MTGLDQFLSLFDCKHCCKVYETPVILPCGELVCEKDIKDIFDNKTECIFCEEEHVIPVGGFPLDKRTHKMLELKVNKLDFGQNYKRVSRLIEKLTDKVSELTLLQRDPDFFITSYFYELRRRVDVRREKLKAKIDAASDKVLEQINGYEKECQRWAKENESDMEKELETSMVGLGKIKKEFDSFEMRYENLSELAVQCLRFKPVLDDRVRFFRKRLLKHTAYKLEVTGGLEGYRFGHLSCYEQGSFTKSTILTKYSEIQNFKKLCHIGNDQRWNLAYRATEDGFSSQNFHAKCDGVRNTLTLIKTTNFHIFGGYTELDWSKSWTPNQRKIGQYKKDPNAFLFCLTNKTEMAPVLLPCVEPEYAICSGDKFGPVFGGGEDLCIFSDSNLHCESFSKLGCSYKHPLLSYDTYEASCFLAGTCNFQTVEIEVYHRL